MTTTIQPTRQARRVHLSHLATTHRAPLVPRGTHAAAEGTHGTQGAATGERRRRARATSFTPMARDPSPTRARATRPRTTNPEVRDVDQHHRITHHPTARHRRRPRAGRRAARRGAIGLGVVLVAQLMLVLDATVVNVALPHIQTDLGFTPAGLSWVLNAYTLAFGGLLLLGGRLGDVFGRLRIFEIGLAIFTVASLLGGLATSPAWLIAARTLQGVGAAFAAPSVLALVTTSAPNEAARNRGLALFTAVSSAGASIGLLLGGILTDYVSWHWTLFVNVPIGAVVLVLARRYVTETPRIRGRFDVVGAITATLGSVSVVHGFISAADRGWASPVTIGSFVVGVLLIALFVRTEGRVSSPLLPLALVRNRTRGGALVLMALVVGAQFSTFFLVTQYLQLVLGFSPVATGAAFLPLSLAIFATSRVSARLVAKVGPRPMLLVGTLGLTASFVWLSTHVDDEHVCRPPPGCAGAQRRLGRARLHAGHGRRPRRRRPRPGRHRVGPAPDRAAARWRRGPRRHRQRLRLAGGPGPVRAGRRAGVPHVGDLHPRGAARRGVRAPAAPAPAW